MTGQPTIEYIDLDETRGKIPYGETCYCVAGSGVTLEEAVECYVKHFRQQPIKVYNQTLPNHWPGHNPSHAFHFPTTSS